MLQQATIAELALFEALEVAEPLELLELVRVALRLNLLLESLRGPIVHVQQLRLSLLFRWIGLLDLVVGGHFGAAFSAAHLRLISLGWQPTVLGLPFLYLLHVVRVSTVCFGLSRLYL